jgi:hypothetical protein
MLLLAQLNITWYLLPLAAVISLVYSASRYEQPQRILNRAGRLFLHVLLFMVAVFVVLLLLSWGL